MKDDPLSGADSLGKAIEGMQRWQAKAGQILKKAVEAACDLVIARSQKNYFKKGGGVGRGYGAGALHFRSGRLANSLHKRVTTKGSHVTQAEVGTSVVYARIHEEGGEIRPVRAKFLHFFVHAADMGFMGMRALTKPKGLEAGQGWGIEVFAKKVTMPARPFLKPALQDMRPQILEVIRAQLHTLWDQEVMKEASRGGQ